MQNIKDALKFVLEHMIPDLPEHKVAEAQAHVTALNIPEAAGQTAGSAASTPAKE